MLIRNRFVISHVEEWGPTEEQIAVQRIGPISASARRF
jgi:hypothetical protein